MLTADAAAVGAGVALGVGGASSGKAGKLSLLMLGAGAALFGLKTIDGAAVLGDSIMPWLDNGGTTLADAGKALLAARLEAGTEMGAVSLVGS